MFEDTFSKRHGYTPPPVQGEKESLSKGARTRLWNIFVSDFWEAHTVTPSFRGGSRISPVAELLFLRGVWTELFNERLDHYPGNEAVLETISSNFERGNWHFPFDIWEQLLKSETPLVPEPEETTKAIREALEKENTAYTFVGGLFVERMEPSEVQSVEKVLRSPIEGIREHFATALRFLSDRDNPDYRNSIKESISAVEAACNYVTHQNKATLESALNTLQNRKPLHPTFKNAVSKLYAWTGDAGGIRHALMEADKVERQDAQFMLVTCSAFVNYLLDR
jgi:hypothetical protein